MSARHRATSRGRGRVRSGVVRATTKWSHLDPRIRRSIVAVAVVEGMLKIAALIDLARRPANQVRGTKARWALAVSLINSLGAVPVAYFVWGRRKTGT